MASNAKRKLFWYDVTTFTGVVFFIGLTAPFAATGIADVFGGLFLFVWWWRRRAYRPLYEASLGQGRLYELAKEADRAYRAFERNTILNEFADCEFCPICQATITGRKNELCGSLRDLYPHCPSDPVPNPNPFEWSWFKSNGYLPPPPDWPKTEFYIAPLDPDVGAMQEEGRPYYELHGNPLWDAGYGRIPTWYKARNTTLPQPLYVNRERMRQNVDRPKRKLRTIEEKKQWWSLESVANEQHFNVERFVAFANERKVDYGIIDGAVCGFKIDSLIDGFRILEAAECDERGGT